MTVLLMVALGLVWGVVSLWLGRASGSGWIWQGLATLVPMVLLAFAGLQAVALGRLRRDAARLREDIGGMGEARAEAEARAAEAEARARAAMAAGNARAQTAPAAPDGSPAPTVTFASRRAPEPADATAGPAPVPPAPRIPHAEPQADLPLGREARAQPPLGTDDLVRALHFPQTPEDTDGFRALRRALKDPSAALVVRAAQDVLTLLSQDGIYMDDLTPDRARPEIWRRFATGERGRPVGALGGVRDPEVLAICGARMREDAVFRDAAHHFLRRFDRLLARLEPDIDDAGLARLAETRTARAFMLLGRVSGVFD